MFLGIAHISDFNFPAISTFVCHFLSVFMLSKRYQQNKVMSVSMRHLQYCSPSSCLFSLPRPAKCSGFANSQVFEYSLKLHFVYAVFPLCIYFTEILTLNSLRPLF